MHGSHGNACRCNCLANLPSKSHGARLNALLAHHGLEQHEWLSGGMHSSLDVLDGLMRADTTGGYVREYRAADRNYPRNPVGRRIQLHENAIRGIPDEYPRRTLDNPLHPPEYAFWLGRDS